MPNDALAPAVALTPWRMFLTADLLVQSVMIILLLASILTWTILLAKGLEMTVAKRRLAEGLRAIRDSDDLGGLCDSGGAPVATAFASCALAEIDASQGLPVEGVKDRIVIGLRRLESGMTRRLQFGTGVLASIGSCAPFIGLLGTVWGIMNSFLGISQAHTTNLSVVAPGIAEALLATACGLLAAIPAVLTYNFLARMMAGYRAGLGDLAALVLTRASRQIDRQLGGQAAASTARASRLRAAVAE